MIRNFAFNHPLAWLSLKKAMLKAALLALCALPVILDANPPKTEASSRTETPALMLMAAIPHRRLQHASKSRTVGMEAVYVETARRQIAGFTLIEMAIVLTIIGLLVGGVLYGQELISKAAARAQISQIEKFNTAANTFFLKYGYLPGDIPDPQASSFGFAPRGGGVDGEGDGNGTIVGNGSSHFNTCIITGEEGTFWVDLSAAHLIDGGFSTATPTNHPATEITGSMIDKYLPAAKIGNGNYVYVWGSAVYYTLTPSYAIVPYSETGTNYFGIAAFTDLSFYNGWPNPGPPVGGSPGITVAQAYAIDKKIDDGLPTSGRVLAVGVTSPNINWTDGISYAYSPAPNSNGSGPVQDAASSASCFDNGNVATQVENYSVTQNNGAGVNCVLSFRMQAGD